MPIFASSVFVGGATDGAGTYAAVGVVRGIVSDSSGNLYVADSSCNCIRKITAAGTASILAGASSTSSGGFNDGAVSEAAFYQPSDIKISESLGAIYVADSLNNRIRKISLADGSVTTIAGDGTAGDAIGQGSLSVLSNPLGVSVNSAGIVFFSDSGNNKIKLINILGFIEEFAGLNIAGQLRNGMGTFALFSFPQGLSDVTPTGIFYVADTGNSAIRRVEISTGTFPFVTSFLLFFI